MRCGCVERRWAPVDRSLQRRARRLAAEPAPASSVLVGMRAVGHALVMLGKPAMAYQRTELICIRLPLLTRPRLPRMVNGLSATCSASKTRWFVRGLAVLMVFVQLAAAAAACPDYAHGQHGVPQDCAPVTDRHQGAGDQICASDFVAADQAPASERTVQLPDLGPPVAVAALWPPAPPAQQAQPRHDAAPLSPVPRFLTLHRLLR